MEEAKTEAKADAKGGGSSKLLMVVVLLNTVVAGGALASSLLRSHVAPAPAPAKGHEGKAEEAAPAEGEHGTAPEGEAAAAEGGGKADGAGRPVARIDNLVVRLRNPEADRFARITIDVELGRASDLGAFQSNLPRVRDSTITTISDYTAEQLAGSTGMAKLKADLMKRISEVMPGGRVTAVYLSDFVVQ